MTVRDNKYISKQDKDLFILLRAGLWHKTEESLSKYPDWEYIYRIADEQTVVGIVADGIIILKCESEIPDDILSKFILHSSNIAKCNAKLNTIANKLHKIFSVNDIEYAIIKGQGIAQYYANPHLRSCGDIDVLLSGTSFYRAASLLKNLSDSIIHQEEGNINFSFDGAIVEIHDKAISGQNKKIDDLLEQERQLMFKQKTYVIINSNDGYYLAPNNQYHIKFIFYHIIKHLMQDGLCLRQLCDFAIFYNNADFDKQELSLFFKNAKIEKLWHSIMSFVILFLGMPQFDCEAKKDNVKLIWINCKRSGCFGRAFHCNRVFLNRHTEYTKHLVGRFIITHRFFPQKAFLTLMHSIRNGFIIGIKKLFGIGGEKFNFDT